jgi:hypothetical protein
VPRGAPHLRLEDLWRVGAASAKHSSRVSRLARNLDYLEIPRSISRGAEGQAFLITPDLGSKQGGLQPDGHGVRPTLLMICLYCLVVWCYKTGAIWRGNRGSRSRAGCII